MKTALQFSLVLAAGVSVVAVGGALRALSGIFQASPLMRKDDYAELQHSFHLWALYSAMAVGITVWLWWTYRQQNNAG